MRRVLDTLRTRFDRILIDVPPVAPLADLHILAPMVDGLLMIVRAGITPKPAIERALAGLDASKVLGLVLNESGGEGTDELQLRRLRIHRGMTINSAPAPAGATDHGHAAL